MKYVFILIFLFGKDVHGQSKLIFNKRFVDCEDKWVAFQMEKDSTYPFGFIYIDAQAGLTMNYEGKFRLSESGVMTPEKLANSNMKVRLKPGRTLVALIPEEKMAELKVEAIPDWLKFYKTDSGSVERLYRWGFLYNGWNECAKALTYLERAKSINPQFKGLQVELAFSYNCLNQYDKAIQVLQEALVSNPSDAYVYKEYVYALIKSGKPDKAADICKKSIQVCTDTAYHGESCYNLLHTFYTNKDKKNFNLWVEETKKWTAGKANLVKSIQAMEEGMSKW